MANNFNLGIDEDDIEEQLEVVRKELPNEELLEVEHKYVAWKKGKRMSLFCLLLQFLY